MGNHLGLQTLQNDDPEELVVDQKYCIVETAWKNIDVERIEKIIITKGNTTVEIHMTSPKEDAQQTAERALSERNLAINMFFLVFLFLLASTVANAISIVSFVVASSFALAAVVVLNAFHLRSIDKLSEKSFLELVGLALMKFFAPWRKLPPNRGDKN